MPKKKLLMAWAKWQQANVPPFVLQDDFEFLDTEKCKFRTVNHLSWEDAIKSSDFCAPGDTRLHLGLIPQPFLGDLRRASIYILLLNPGLGPHDYYGEYEVESYREALLDNLKQIFPKNNTPFIFLNPQFSWHGGFNYWHRKLYKIIEVIASEKNISFAKARDFLSRKIASIELLPYHSLVFRDACGWLNNLPSVAIARNFVSDYVLPRVKDGKAIVIITRQVRRWNVPEGNGVIVYTGTQSRAAHLTPNSPGGQAILKQLGILDLP